MAYTLPRPMPRRADDDDGDRDDSRGDSNALMNMIQHAGFALDGLESNVKRLRAKLEPILVPDEDGGGERDADRRPTMSPASDELAALASRIERAAAHVSALIELAQI